jgi:hypothetical protein
MGRKQPIFLTRAIFELLGQFIRVLQVISDDLIDIRQLQDIVLLHDLLGGGPPVERSHHEIERDTSTADAICALRVSGQWNCVNDSRHIQIVAQSPRQKQGPGPIW